MVGIPLLILIASYVSPQPVRADSLVVEASPLRIETTSSDLAPVLALKSDGRIVLSWMGLTLERDTAQIYLAESPDWIPSVVTSLPLTPEDPGPIPVISGKGNRLAWSHALTQTRTIQSYALGANELSEEWIGPRVDPWAFRVDDGGKLHIAWVEGHSLNYVDDAQATTITIAIEPEIVVDELSLALGPSDGPYLAWSSSDALGQAAGIYYAPAVSGTTPVSITSAGIEPHLRIGPSGRAHLCWFDGGGLYYADSQDWGQVHLIDQGLAPSDSFAMAVGPGEVVHLIWLKENTLWYATSLDWYGSLTPLFAPLSTPQLSLVIDDWGRPHAAWAASAPGDDEGRDIYYLSPPQAPQQLRIVFPEGGEILSRDPVLWAETNVTNRDLVRVEFYLQRESIAEDETGPWLSLGLDREGRDGWSLPLHTADLDPTSRYRVMALGTDPGGRTLRALGGWFEVRPQDGSWISLYRDGPERTLGRASLLALSGSARDLSHLDLFLTPERCTVFSGLESAIDPSLCRDIYLGTYYPEDGTREQPPQREPLYRQRLVFDSRDLPDGPYVANALAEDRLGNQVRSTDTRPFTLSNTLSPIVEVISPQKDALVKDTLTASARAEDLDGSVQGVEFYLEQEQPSLETQIPNGPHVIWLGRDADGLDGWGVRVPVDESWQGENWYVRAVARDSSGLATDARGDGTFTILNRGQPYVRILRPTGDERLSGVVRVAVSVEESSQHLGQVELYFEDLTGSLTYLGQMEQAVRGWADDWDTRSVPDGLYWLVVVGERDDERRSLVRSKPLSVTNHPTAYTFQAGMPGETVRGPTPVRLHSEPGLPSVDGVRFYLRDGSGEMHFIGQDVFGENGWGTIWNTFTVLDGEYQLLALISTQGGSVSQIQKKVRVVNTSLSITLQPFPADDEFQGFERIYWRATHPAAKPVSVTVEYSPDGGNLWMLIAEDTRAVGSCPWNTVTYPDSSNGLLRLIVTDGVHYGAATSAPLVLNNVNEAPYVTLSSPNVDHGYGSVVQVAWQAWDPDGDVLAVDLDYRRTDGVWSSLARQIPNSGKFAWDVGQLPPGVDYELRITVTDPMGQLGTDLISGIRLSANHPPTVRLVWPNRGVTLAKEAAILWQAKDEDDDELHVDLYYSDNAGQAWIPLAEGLANTGYYVWQISFFPPGTQYRMRVVARDASSRAWDESDGVFTVGRDSQPQIGLLSPVSDSTVSGVQPIRWLAFSLDRSPLRVSLMLRAAGQADWDLIATDLPDDGFYLWDTKRKRDGQYDLRITVRSDQSLTSAGLTVPILVSNPHNHPPQVKLTSPQGGEIWTGVREISWQAWDRDGDTITATLSVSTDGGKSWRGLGVADGLAGRYLWDTRQAPSGQRSLVNVVVTDGNASAKDTSSGAFSIANQESHPPHLLITMPDDDSSLDGSLVTWIAEDVDQDALSIDISLSDDGGTTWRVLATSLLNTGEYVMDGPLTPGIPYQLRLRASDGLYDALVTSRPFERAIPQGQLPELEIRSPVARARWSSIEAIRWDASDPMGQTLFVDIEWSADGGQIWGQLASGVENTGQHDWDTSRVPNGTYLLRLTASNGRFSVARVSPSFLVDNDGGNPPEASFVSPSGGEVWSGTREVTWRASDADGDLLSVQLAYSIDRGHTWLFLSRSLPNTGNYVWDTTTVPNSEEVWLRLTASDRQFTTQAHSATPFAVCNSHPPRVSLLVPRERQRWSGKQLISWCATQASGRIVRVALDISLDMGNTWQVLASDLPPKGSYLWDTTAVRENARVLVRARALDGLHSGVDTLWEPITIRGNVAPASFPLLLR